MADIEVRNSKIHWKGVFALKDFKKGETVVDWFNCSTQLTKSQVNKLPKYKRKHISYLGNDKWVLFKSPGKYMNHSCDPNTKAVNGKDVAVRPINKGDEITVDYIS